MTILISIDSESGEMRRYDSRMRAGRGGWCRYVSKDIDWPAVRAAGAERDVIHTFMFAPSWRDHV